MQIDLNRLTQVYQERYISAVNSSFGDDGATALEALFDGIQRLYRVSDPYRRDQELFVFRRIPGITPTVTVGGTPTVIVATNGIPAGIQHEVNRQCIVEIVGHGEYRIWGSLAVSIDDLSRESIVYRWHENTDWLVIAGVTHAIPNLIPKYASALSKGAYEDLHEALDAYKLQMVRTSTCPLFSGIWEDGNRLFVRDTDPEKDMRNSLTHFLSCRLNALVRPEQNVDDSHPVDIRVQWEFANREALIEIKWMGDTRKNGAISTQHRGYRANQGAKQLVDYIDSNRTSVPTQTTRGILVVIDARRAGLNATSTTVTRADGFHYEHDEITYNPDYHVQKPYFERPTRMFAEPIC